jgi:hypothetical protein
MKRYEYRIITEIISADLHDYHTRLADIAKRCGILKFVVFQGHGFWENELHLIIKMEFSRSNVLTDNELRKFLSEIDSEFRFGQSAIFVMYEEVTR